MDPKLVSTRRLGNVAGNRISISGVFDRRYGGDLQGILNRLDYLQDLGVNTLYLNPIFFARSSHKYDGNSFHHVDPYFGPDPARGPGDDPNGIARSGHLADDGG